MNGVIAAPVRRLAALLLVPVWLLGCSANGGSGEERTAMDGKVASVPADTAVAATPRPTRARVIRVVDGDTLKVAHLSGPSLPSRTVRLIGVDTPEVHQTREPYGREASQFTRNHLEGAVVWLTKDVRQTDRYGRALRYVWTDPPTALQEGRPVPDSLFNAQLVREGYAHASTVPPDVRYADRFRLLQREAREHRRGLWAREVE